MRLHARFVELLFKFLRASSVQALHIKIINSLSAFPGFTGTQCEIDIDECSTAPCLNGGTCLDHINSFKCACSMGFTGNRCQTNVDDCESQPCKNGGICRDAIAGYSCECPPGYKGT